MESIQKIAQFLPKERKTMFFSATMKRKANDLAKDVLKKERLFISNEESAAIPSLKQVCTFNLCINIPFSVFGK
jgi:superfamily II DNA/RNA helicase